jgi:hypothetical protein
VAFSRPPALTLILTATLSSKPRNRAMAHPA